ATLLLTNNNNNSSLCSYSSPTSSSPPLSLANDHEVPSNGISQGEGVSLEVDTIESSDAITKVNEGGSQSHAAIDDESMEEMRSLGEQYQMEWNDTMNLVTSTLWFNFLKKMEHNDDAPQEDACNHVYDEFMEFPAWLNAQEDLNLPW
ncbi:transcription factor btd-like, partial [Trifolium medium]|nr:transcription factor btd-like [Trifolium medium]